MNLELLQVLACPKCGRELELRAPSERPIATGTLVCVHCRRYHPIVDHVPRFVPSQNYASNFGFQWARYPRTQLDSHTRRSISRDRFFMQSGWEPEDLRDRWVLDVGCGTGRFAEVALASGARVVAVDYSRAADVCWQNLGNHPRIDVLQADVYALPFRPGAFDFVYCFGVLQHTPDVRAAFLALTKPLRSGGRLAVDVYPKRATTALWPKYWLRPITTRISSDRLFRIVEQAAPALLPVSNLVGRVPRIGHRLRHLVPVANYEGVLPLERDELREWAVLDTFDMLSPRFDKPQSAATLSAWFREAGLVDVEVFRPNLVVGRGVKP